MSHASTGQAYINGIVSLPLCDLFHRMKEALTGGLEQCFNKSMSKEDESRSAEDINGGFFFLEGKYLTEYQGICCSHYPMINGAVLRISGLRPGKKSPSKEYSLMLCSYQDGLVKQRSFSRFLSVSAEYQAPCPQKVYAFGGPSSSECLGLKAKLPMLLTCGASTWVRAMRSSA